MSWSTNCPHCMSMSVKSRLGRFRSAIKASLIALGEGRVDLSSDIWPRGTDTPAKLFLHIKHNVSCLFRVATIPERVTLILTPAKSGSQSTPVTSTPPKSCNLPYIVEPNPESDSDSFWEKSRLQATPIPGIVATLICIPELPWFAVTKWPLLFSFLQGSCCGYGIARGDRNVEDQRHARR